MGVKSVESVLLSRFTKAVTLDSLVEQLLKLKMDHYLEGDTVVEVRGFPAERVSAKYQPQTSEVVIVIE